MKKLSLSAVALLLATSISGAAMADVSATLEITGLDKTAQDCVNKIEPWGSLTEVSSHLYTNCKVDLEHLKTLKVVAH